ncbi:hypothetical protein [Helicobacter pylori]|uniref:Putative n=1 Tax=Helicobacter pylori (strain J99 / ATCC 700824) TaxID=85963 RepID=Q9ZN33_HELPJ|nr:hypothetical protein [Helicobacter pylori]AAD05610.1 putative [Helicobacter pylori J99]AKE81951.1 hypothetical protein YH61_04750 [Helicobacter pylori J99]AVL48663.1 hypothetical protein CEP79_03620 [Helicobacter pylori]MWR19562.1 hypothetical protein [Helicobacter pylori]MWR35457.1 hypothetical protein [Helicobacter pylori]
MLLNYDFLELVDDEPQRNTSLTSAIDKALADKKLARQNKPRVRVKDNLSLSETLDAYGRELSRLKNQQETIKASTIESSNLNSIVNKIKSGLPFGTISAFRPFKEAFIKDFTQDERELLVEAYKSGYKASQLDKVSKKWRDDPNPIDASYLADAFLREYRTIALKLSTALGKPFVNKFLNPKSETTMKDFMSSEKFVKKYRFTQKDNIKRTQELKSLLDQKRHFLGYLQVTGYWKDKLNDPLLPSKEVSFFVFQNEPSNSFNLKDQLLDLAKYFNQEAICYCQNAETGKVDLVLATEKDFGKVDMTFTGITFTIPLTQSITRLHNKVYTFFDKQGKDNYGVFFDELSTTKLKAMSIPKIADEFYRHLENRVKSFIRARQYHGSPRTFDADDIEKYELQAIKRLDLQRCAKSKSFKASYNHNIKINNLANALRQGKEVSKTLITKVLANTIDTDAGYCFISDLATQLGNISPRLSKSIVTAIEQAEGIRLLYALIDKVSYNSLHNTLNFIFDIDNPMSDQSLNELVVEVPREALKNVKLPQIKNELTSQIFDGAYQFRGNDYQFKG